MEHQRRKDERSKVWTETQARLDYEQGSVSVVGRVDNLSVSGMYVLTEKPIPIETVVDIVIDFEPGQTPPNTIQATGCVIRQEENGVAIHFEEIDGQFLGECMLAKLINKKSSSHN